MVCRTVVIHVSYLIGSRARSPRRSRHEKHGLLDSFFLHLFNFLGESEELFVMFPPHLCADLFVLYT